jgi:hypothetical protein
MFPFLGFVGDVVEDLVRHDGGYGTTDLVVTLNVDLVFTLFRKQMDSGYFLLIYYFSRKTMIFCIKIVEKVNL